MSPAKPSKRTKALIGVALLAGAGVAIDQVFLLPASASAKPSGTSAAAGPGPVPSAPPPAPPPPPRDLTALRDAIERLAGEADAVDADLFLRPGDLGDDALAAVVDDARSALPPDWPALDLSAVIVSDTGAAAVINGRALRVGARVRGAELVDIGPYHATVRYQGAVRRLELPRPSIDAGAR